MKTTIIVDIDGTISKVGDRLKYLQQTPKNWDAFYDACFDDEPMYDIISMLLPLTNNFKLIFCTGRRESVREKTVQWIFRHLGIFTTKEDLLMRPDEDYRHDTAVKPEQLEKAGVKLDEILFVLEDRRSMVEQWREMGLTCLQVADGDF